jgi:mono/diheme cytochrome c family protein
MNPMVAILLALAAALAVLRPDWAGSQQPPAVKSPPLIIQSLAGRDLYDFYCVSCHGRSGKGDGPAAAKLKERPPDLTTLAARNGGTFPKDRVEQILIGERPSTSHGSKEMPVWGNVFRFLDPNDQRARIRVTNLAAYLASLQAKK